MGKLEQVVAASEAPLDEAGCPRVIDARGKWVVPGFVDVNQFASSKSTCGRVTSATPTVLV